MLGKVTCFGSMQERVRACVQLPSNDDGIMYNSHIFHCYLPQPTTRASTTRAAPAGVCVSTCGTTGVTSRARLASATPGCTEAGHGDGSGALTTTGGRLKNAARIAG